MTSEPFQHQQSRRRDVDLATWKTEEAGNDDRLTTLSVVSFGSLSSIWDHRWIFFIRVWFANVDGFSCVSVFFFRCVLGVFCKLTLASRAVSEKRDPRGFLVM